MNLEERREERIDTLCMVEFGKEKTASTLSTCGGLSTLPNTLWLAEPAHEPCLRWAFDAASYLRRSAEGCNEAASEQQWHEEHLGLESDCLLPLHEPKKKHKKCHEVGMCLCTKRGRAIEKIHKRIMAHLRICHLFEGEKLLIEGFVALEVCAIRPAPALAGGALVGAPPPNDIVVQRRFFHVSLQYLKPLRATVLEMAPHDRASPMNGGLMLKVKTLGKELSGFKDFDFGPYYDLHLALDEFDLRCDLRVDVWLAWCSNRPLNRPFVPGTVEFERMPSSTSVVWVPVGRRPKAKRRARAAPKGRARAPRRPPPVVAVAGDGVGDAVGGGGDPGTGGSPEADRDHEEHEDEESHPTSSSESGAEVDDGGSRLADVDLILAQLEAMDTLGGSGPGGDPHGSGHPGEGEGDTSPHLSDKEGDDAGEPDLPSSDVDSADLVTVNSSDIASLPSSWEDIEDMSEPDESDSDDGGDEGDGDGEVGRAVGVGPGEEDGLVAHRGPRLVREGLSIWDGNTLKAADALKYNHSMRNFYAVCNNPAHGRCICTRKAGGETKTSWSTSWVSCCMGTCGFRSPEQR
jgi:hypothetical protein